MIRERFTYDEEICRKCLDDEDDIAVIRDLAANLPMFADLMRVNIFIDCLTKEKDKALVIAEAFPLDEDPLYQYSVVGKDVLEENEPGVLRALRLGVISRGTLGLSQEMFPIRQISVPIFGKDKEHPIGVLIRESSADDQQRAEEKLAFIQEASSSFTDALYNLELKNFDIAGQIREGIILFDKNGKVTYYNRGASVLYKRMGYEGTLMGRSFEDVALTDDGEDRAAFLESSFTVREVSLHDLDLEVRYARNKKSQEDQICMLIRDVTGEKESEKRDRLQSFLVNEMNHRIKNNLQTVASILSLQSRSIQDPAAKQIFSESVNRIQSIAEVHNQLSKTGRESVDVLMLVERICENVAGMAGMDYEIMGKSAEISAAKASALGLIINELVQNVVKHAVPKDGERKKVTVEVGCCFDQINVNIWDNGSGFKPGAERNLGLMLVERLVREPLHGNLEIKNSEKNSVITLEFSI